MALTEHDYPDWQRPLSTADLNTDFNDSALAAGSSVSFPLTDVRRFSSVGIRAGYFCNSAPASYQPVSIVVEWWDDPGNTGPIWVEAFQVWAKNAGGGAFAVNNAWLYIAQACMAPYLMVTMTNNGSVQMTCGGTVLGHSRSLAGTFVREGQLSSPSVVGDTDAKVSDGQTNIGAGATAKRILRLHVGRAKFEFIAGGQPGTFTVISTDGSQIYQVALAAGGVDRPEIVLPSQTCRVEITNTGAAAGNFRNTVILDRSAW